MAEQGSQANGELKGATRRSGAFRFLVGPGFEIAVRAGEGRPVNMTVDRSRRGSDRSGKHATDHGHTQFEQRLEAVEASLVYLARQIEDVESKVDAVKRSARDRPHGE